MFLGNSIMALRLTEFLRGGVLAARLGSRPSASTTFALTGVRANVVKTRNVIRNGVHEEK